jgi:hypothetical protein
MTHTHTQKELPDDTAPARYATSCVDEA